MPDIKILSTHAVQEVLRELGPMFERVSGFSLKIDYDPANTLRRTIETETSRYLSLVRFIPDKRTFVAKCNVRYGSLADMTSLMIRSEQMPDIKILSTHAVQEVLRELGPMFERVSGFSLKIDYDPANTLRRTIEGGASFDVVIVTRPVIDELALLGRVRRETCTDIGRSGLGVAVRKGAVEPDIATVDAFRRSLLAARSLVRSKEGTSGLYFETLLDRLGIAEIMRDKIVLGPSGRVAELVARGEAQIAVQQIPELLPVKGIQYVGPLPAELQLYTVFAAGIGSATKDRAVAKAFVDALITPSNVALFKAKGLEPVLR